MVNRNIWGEHLCRCLGQLWMQRWLWCGVSLAKIILFNLESCPVPAGDVARTTSSGERMTPRSVSPGLTHDKGLGIAHTGYGQQIFGLHNAQVWIIHSLRKRLISAAKFHNSQLSEMPP